MVNMRIHGIFKKQFVGAEEYTNHVNNTRLIIMIRNCIIINNTGYLLFIAVSI